MFCLLFFFSSRVGTGMIREASALAVKFKGMPKSLAIKINNA